MKLSSDMRESIRRVIRLAIDLNGLEGAKAVCRGVNIDERMAICGYCDSTTMTIDGDCFECGRDRREDRHAR